MQKSAFCQALLDALTNQLVREGVPKANRRERLLYSLLVVRQQFRDQRRYTHAEWARELRQVVERSTNYREVTATILAMNEETPASNTGVTDTGGAVPEELFTRGK